MIPDLSFYNVPSTEEKDTGAIQITCPGDENKMSVTQALKKGRAARKARKAKETKCIPICNIARFEFQILIFE